MGTPGRTRRLDLGCGTDRQPGAVGVDRNPRARPDVLADLDRPPYPFADDSFDEILLDNVLEHLGDVPAVLTEVHRIARPEALVTVVVPYFRSRWSAIDPTHRHQFSVDSMGYFDRAHPYFERYRYVDVGFSVTSVAFNENVAPEGRGAWLRRAVVRVANRQPERYEQWLSPLLPLDTLTFRLRVHKP